MKERDIGKLETLVGDYRRATLRHLISRGSGVIDGQAHFILE